MFFTYRKFNLYDLLKRTLPSCFIWVDLIFLTFSQLATVYLLFESYFVILACNLEFLLNFLFVYLIASTHFDDILNSIIIFIESVEIRILTRSTSTYMYFSLFLVITDHLSIRVTSSVLSTMYISLTNTNKTTIISIISYLNFILFWKCRMNCFGGYSN